MGGDKREDCDKLARLLIVPDCSHVLAERLGPSLSA